MGHECLRNCDDGLCPLTPAVAVERLDNAVHIMVDPDDTQAGLERIFDALQEGKTVVVNVAEEEAADGSS